MDELSKKRFDEILEKPVAELTNDDKIFLKARRGYLKGDQVKIYEDVIEEKVTPEAPVTAKEPTLKELKTRAAELGIDHKGKKKEEIQVAISTVEGPAGAPQPE